MLSKATFNSLLPLIIDGALATELEIRGHDLNHPLWSGKILRSDPDAIKDVHLDYFHAGANVAITASYQTSVQGLVDSFGIGKTEARELIKRSVQVAQDAREEVKDGKMMLVAGSVGPYGAYLHDGNEYRGDYVRTQEELKEFHRPRMQALVEAGVDLLAIETIPNFEETRALLDLLREEVPQAIAWLSFTTKDPGHIADGTPWSEVLQLINQHSDQIVAVGVNCVPMAGVTETLRNMEAQTDIPLLCYPNSGEVFDSATNSWHGERPDDVLEGKSEHRFDTGAWTSHGAKLIGGCCRTGPAFVKAVCADLRGDQGL